MHILGRGFSPRSRDIRKQELVARLILPSQPWFALALKGPNSLIPRLNPQPSTASSISQYNYLVIDSDRPGYVREWDLKGFVPSFEESYSAVSNIRNTQSASEVWCNEAVLSMCLPFILVDLRDVSGVSYGQIMSRATCVLAVTSCVLADDGDFKRPGRRVNKATLPSQTRFILRLEVRKNIRIDIKSFGIK